MHSYAPILNSIFKLFIVIAAIKNVHTDVVIRAKRGTGRAGWIIRRNVKLMLTNLGLWATGTEKSHVCTHFWTSVCPIEKTVQQTLRV